MITKDRKKIINQEELERRILQGLSCEWQQAVWVLSPSYRKRMRAPLFSLGVMRDRWGFWSGEKREISLSRDLVFNHSWDAVREVLLHEIAHQFTEEVLAPAPEPPHGPHFQNACHLLRANPKASGKFIPLDKRIYRGQISYDSHSPEDKMMHRVKKLLALAESPNQHEAEAAMAKAHDLIVRYNLSLLARDDNRNFASISVGSPALRHFSEDYSLAHLLQDFYFIKGIWMSNYVPEKGKMGRVLEISGTIQNIKMASYVHDFVQNFIRSQWFDYNKDKRLNRFRQSDFAVGIIEGFRSKLESPKKGKDPTALMKIEDPQLTKYFSYRYPRTVQIQRGARGRDEKVLKDGKRIGRSLVIAKGISESTGNRGLRIQGGNGKLPIPAP